jgi:hypothetical protein
MSTDDRDTESSNPSKSFKVGEFDRLSGFFTPVWESKRRLRSESRPPSSSPGVPSSARSADKNGRPSTPPSPPPSRRTGGAVSSSGGASISGPSTPPLAVPASPAESAPGASPSPLPPAVAPTTQRDGEACAVAHPAATRPITPASANTLAQTNEPSASSSAAAEAPELPAADTAMAQVGADAHVAAALAAAAAVTVRPVIPMPSTPGRLPPRPKPPSAPSAASDALKQASPHLESGDSLDREPALRAPAAAVPRRGPSPEVQRSARVTAAATSLHERLKTKVPIDSVDTFARHRETESEREALQAAAARAALMPSDPYPGHVLRTLRRTIHLSTPLPDDVRQMIEKYRH